MSAIFVYDRLRNRNNFWMNSLQNVKPVTSYASFRSETRIDNTYRPDIPSLKGQGQAILNGQGHFHLERAKPFSF